MGDPSRGTPDGEQHREHVEGNPDGPQDDARVEVDVGVEPALREVVVGQRSLLHLPGDVEQRVVDVHRLQEVVGGFLEDPRARIEVAVDAVPEPHEPDPGFPVLGLGQVGTHRHALVADLLQHLDHTHVRPAVQRSPEGRDPRGNGGEQVRAAGCDHPHRGG